MSSQQDQTQQIVQQSYNQFVDSLNQENEDDDTGPSQALVSTRDVQQIINTLAEYRTMIIQQAETIRNMATTIGAQANQIIQLQQDLSICRISAQSALNHAAVVESPMVEAVKQVLAETVTAPGQRIAGADFNKRVAAIGARKNPPIAISAAMVYKIMNDRGYPRTTIGNNHYYPNLAWRSVSGN